MRLRRSHAAAAACLGMFASTLPVFAATPAPKATAAPRVDITKVQPKAIAPKRPLHVEYTVEINRLGQVAVVRTVKPSKDESFDAHTYGNALQAFIRTPDNRVVVGTYRLTYDYDPKTMRVQRDVALLRRGGVNPNAKGAAESMMEIARRNGHRTPPPAYYVTPGPVPTVNIKRMPDLPQVMRSATPAPHP